MSTTLDVTTYRPFMWMVPAGAFGSFLFSFGTGSNDVSNAFATSVGSGTLTMPQAIVIAAIFEFIGGIVLGNTNANVIAGGIADRASFPAITTQSTDKTVTVYSQGPYLYAFGMLLVMWVGGFFQLIASRIELNVSATHAVIGGLMGFAIAHRGADGVLWAIPDDTKFPPYKGLVPVVISWFFSPVFSGICSFIMFMTIRTFILRAADSARKAYYVLPVAVFATIWINTFFICSKGAKSQLDKEQWNAGTASWVAAVVAGFFALVSIALIPILAKRVENRMTKEAEVEAETEKGLSEDTTPLNEGGPKSIGDRISDYLGFTEVKLSKEREAELAEENKIDEFDPEKAEKFDKETEYVFNYLQVVTAVAVIFAHGANETSYAAAPLCTIYDVVHSATTLRQKPVLAKEVSPQLWMLFISAFGLVSGLFLYGARLTWASARKFIKLSASRGFCAELATAIVITVAAQYGLPTSSSQCITGAMVGVGCAEGIGAVNWRYFGQTFFAWVFTMFIMGITVGLIFAFATFSPQEVNP